MVSSPLLKKLICILAISISGIAFAQQNAVDINDSVEDFDAIVDEGNPAGEVFFEEEPDGLVEDAPESADPEMPQISAEPKSSDVAPVVIDKTNKGPEIDFEEDTIEKNPEPLPYIRQDKGKTVIRKRNQRYIEHPNAEKGLIRIDKERVYFYKQTESEKKASVSFQVGSFNPSNLANPDIPTYTYEDVYGGSNLPMILLNYEKKLFKKVESLRYYFGGGFYYADGEGQFDTTGSVGGLPPETPQEKFSLFVFPLSFGVNYYLHIFENQWLIPYGGGGITGFLFGERRDDDLNPDFGAKWGLSPAAHFQAGGAFKLGRGPRAFLDLDREYGINSMWLTIEYKNYTALSDTFDFSSDFIGGGLYLVY